MSVYNVVKWHVTLGLCDVGVFENRQARNRCRLKTNVQDNNQKPTVACPARTTAAMLLMPKITTSCPNIAKPHVGSSFISSALTQLHRKHFYSQTSYKRLILYIFLWYNFSNRLV